MPISRNWSPAVPVQHSNASVRPAKSNPSTSAENAYLSKATSDEVGPSSKCKSQSGSFSVNLPPSPSIIDSHYASSNSSSDPSSASLPPSSASFSSPCSSSPSPVPSLSSSDLSSAQSSP